ncbi:LysR family transcriptional regulator [Nocardioides sp. zg-579]|uniref:LysR family transcriptional regulator n=1 Tax=Nocardioides marmotae TaxID=2663857 RepID=A0A6I3J5J5_9ACTN|nr:LysR substrate-binding domain-containing protein [Nocardioides marmotae]MCR6030917.1 LysR family transcriptional regulator [Gordonia jinghuaiqii]MTB94554.1 LysR family transcriptional regulator [Nocardioides marmotae]QKE01431.1 LysR family transcriptional regulator [Nocardioides marmotae]
MTPPFRVGFVTGATPDKWARNWRERRRREPLELVPVTEEDQERVLRDGEVDMCLVRLPVNRDGLHVIALYDELPVAVVGTEHLLTLAEEVTLADLAEEQLVLPHRSGWRPDVPQLDWPPMSVKDAIEVVASGTGVVILPMSVARLHNRKDVEHRVVTDLAPTTVALAWRVERDDEQCQAFVGIVRGRTARSTRG